MPGHLHLVIPDLFLPQEASVVCADLRLPALEAILARADVTPAPATSLEEWLGAAFGAEGQGIAPITLQGDGLQPGNDYWLRADPVYLGLQHDKVVLQANVGASAEEAADLCAALNKHFAADGLHFLAPHPQRWYLRLASAPGITTVPVAQVAGMDIHAHLPHGQDALRWHGMLNEIQMLLYAHPVNRAREERGEQPINGLWLWGGGYAAQGLRGRFTRVYADDATATAFAAVAGIGHAPLPAQATDCLAGGGETLIVWDKLRNALQHRDLGQWRDHVQGFERNYAAMLLQALRRGSIDKITLDAVQASGSQRFVLTRGGTWRIWRRCRIDQYFT